MAGSASTCLRVRSTSAALSTGSDFVAKAEPDGYTLLFTAPGPLTVNQTLYSKLPFDPAKDFAPVALFATAPIVLIDRDLERFPAVWAAAGTPNSVFQITPADLARLTKGQVVDIAKV